jgi:prepilin-type N-terminal cleavage/methylation domain-containing protein
MRARSNLPNFCPKQHRQIDRRGFTIMELLLVMTVLVMVGALSAPSFVGWAENQRLRKSGDIIRTAWARARIKAMKTGETIVFRYEIGGNRYRMEAWETPGEMASYGMTTGFEDETPLVLPSASDDESTTDVPAPTAASPLSGGTGIPAVEQVLPRDILFAGSEIELDERDLFMQGQMMDTAMAANWSSPILFYPDGSASQTQLQLTDSNATRFVLVSLRGMTGLAQATGILSAEEIGP